MRRRRRLGGDRRSVLSASPRRACRTPPTTSGCGRRGRHRPDRLAVVERSNRARAPTTGPHRPGPWPTSPSPASSRWSLSSGRPTSMSRSTDRRADQRREDLRRLERTSSRPPPSATAPTAISGPVFADANPDAEPAADPRVGDLERAELLDLLVAEAGPGRLRRADQAVGEGPRQGRSRGPGDERRHVRDPAVGRSDRLLRLHRSALYDPGGVDDAIDVVGVHPYGPDVDSVIEPGRGHAQGPRRGRERLTDLGRPRSAGAPTRRSGTISPRSPSSRRACSRNQLRDTLRLARRARAGGGRLVHVARLRSMPTPSGPAAGAPPPASSTPTATAKPSWLAFTDLTGGTP